MYEVFYKLNADPFRLSPDARFCFAHPSYAKARAYLAYGLKRSEGLIAVTGTPGTGKSTLVEDLLGSLNASRMVIARIVSTQIRATDLLRLIAFQFRIRAEGMDKASLLQNVETYLVSQAAAGRRVLLIVDEAQDLSMDALEELRLLTNMQVSGKPMLQIFLLGQEQLHDKIASPEMEQLRQRLVAVSRLLPMSAEETRDYIAHRLTKVGWRGDPEISGEAVEIVYRYSRGIPRLVNQTCSRLLLFGSAENKHKLYGGDALVVVRELEDEMPPAGGASVLARWRKQDAFLDKNASASERPVQTSTVRLTDISASSIAVQGSPASQNNVAESEHTAQSVRDIDAVQLAAETPAELREDSPAFTGAQPEEYDQSFPLAAANTPARTGRLKYYASAGLSLLAVGLVGGGVLTVAALESEPLGTQLAGWSRSVANGMQRILPANRAAPDNNGGESGQTSTSKNVAPKNVTTDD